MIYSVFRTGKSYFPQVFLQGRNYIIKKKISNYIIDAVENSHEEGSSKEDSNEKDSNKKDSAEENSYEEDSDKENFDEEHSDEEDSGKK